MKRLVCKCKIPHLELDRESNVVHCKNCQRVVLSKAEAAVVRIVEAALERVLERQAAEQVGSHPNTLIDATEVARRLGRTRGWLYAHADELGAIRIGNGPKPRLMFDPRRIDEIASAPDRQGFKPQRPEANGQPRRRPRPASSSPPESLLEIKGERT